MHSFLDRWILEWTQWTLDERWKWINAVNCMNLWMNEVNECNYMKLMNNENVYDKWIDEREGNDYK